ncbi:RsiW-degrading membrane proteinase PrsW (M82 family) [Alicyclobacillus sacchari]|uniref:Protease PrsW n=1 Tax=Alicyclobacillus sacchari TaxID=392010 RepID=A0A4R8LJ52_9BACL|nr:PrsW family glutamic-type intramembrane protease [Alicyclobacillus sacchari]TDY43462.1 RsiW-degrading membrane proteinase PrsW (M82 family) [Alicyclobacillus sacchari]GMA55778.1 protease PrsW [Alicyclobacillus sacchari]
MLYVALAVIPGLFLLIFIYTRDQLHPEPKRQIVRLFLLGAAIVFPAGLIERITMDSPGFQQGGLEGRIITAFFVAGMIEEFLKASIFDRTVLHSGLIRGRVDCIVYAAAIGLGFATVENILYVTSSGFLTAIVRSVTAVPAHFMFAIIMGYRFAKTKFDGKNKAFAYLLPALAHGTYDTFALASTLWADIILAVLLVILAEISAKILRNVGATRHQFLHLRNT